MPINDRLQVVTGPRSLWAEVLFRGLADYVEGRDPSWIESDDFDLVASWAGLDPDIVRERVTSLDPTSQRFRRGGQRAA